MELLLLFLFKLIKKNKKWWIYGDDRIRVMTEFGFSFRSRLISVRLIIIFYFITYMSASSLLMCVSVYMYKYMCMFVSPYTHKEARTHAYTI